MTPSSSSSPTSVRTITAEEHLGHLEQLAAAGGWASFLQTPAWGRVKTEWRHESIGWFAHRESGTELVGVGLVLYRSLPRLRRSLAYLPEGPVIDWDAQDLRAWLNPMVRHLSAAGAFGIRIGPPVITRRWDAAIVKAGVADPDVRRLGELAPTERPALGARVVSQLNELGWRSQTVEEGFAAGQPQYNFMLALRHPDQSPRTEQDVLAGMNQLWRRNIKKAEKSGVEVTRVQPAGGDPDAAEALRDFHALYLHTAERDHFTARPLSYFETMAGALGEEDPDRFSLYLARHDGDLVAATVAVRVGSHVWYSYGASSSSKREVRGSNAAQWAMIRDAIAAGARVYDLRGITDTVDPDDPHAGLVQFKVGTGGEAVEYAGEWDLPVNPVLYKAFSVYMQRRSGRSAR